MPCLIISSHVKNYGERIYCRIKQQGVCLHKSKKQKFFRVQKTKENLKTCKDIHREPVWSLLQNFICFIDLTVEKTADFKNDLDFG